MSEEEVLKCSFCGRTRYQVYTLIAGSRELICDECVCKYVEKVDRYLKWNEKECSFCGK